MTDENYEARAQAHLASLKRDMRVSLEDAAVRAMHKVMAEFEAKSDERLMEDWGPGPHECHSLPARGPEQPAQPRAWFTVDELNAWAEKKLKENPQWADQPAQRCPLCNYQHGHAIGCKNNPVDIALNKMAENARELGLDYEQPAQQEPVECQYGKGGYACCEGGPCKADEQNNAPRPAQQQEPVAGGREVFEQIHGRDNPAASFRKLDNGDYLCGITQSAWEGWRACATHHTAQQEPVYFCDYGYEGWGKVDAAMAAENLACGMTVEAYYTSPPASKPLTDDEFISMVDSAGIAIDPGLAFEIKEMVEAAHGIKGDA